MKTTNNPLSIRFAKSAILVAALAASAAPSSHALYDYVANYDSATPSLSVSNSGLVQIGLTGESVLNAASTGVILQGNSTTQLGNVQQMYDMMVSGYNGGNWLGTSGITSPQAQADGTQVLGVTIVNNALTNIGSWAGLSGLGALDGFRQTLLRLSYRGDFNGDGQINSLDYGVLDFYLGSVNELGDLQGDGNVNSLDYGVLDYVLGAQSFGNLGNLTAFSGGGDKPSGGSLVPEPGSMGLLLLGAVGLLGSRKRKQAQQN